MGQTTMKLRSIHPSWSSLLIVWVVLLGVCLLENQGALYKMEVRDSFVLINSRTIHNMALIDFINGHPHFVGGYLLLILGVLAFCAWRKHPSWSVWVTSGVFAVPCFLYGAACNYITWKFMGLYPSRPESRKPSPEETVSLSQPWPLRRSLEDHELMAERQVFERERRPAREECS